MLSKSFIALLCFTETQLSGNVRMSHNPVQKHQVTSLISEAFLLSYKKIRWERQDSKIPSLKRKKLLNPGNCIYPIVSIYWLQSLNSQWETILIVQK